ncbi:hypothetical protein CAPTEDRAFT_221535 [Capitella teleta]|uniref:CARD domain-containing protein n=1 Tax=Capitella teleta TaxID=283909 RepID=R7T7V5_CAPTE|nr:hypothetical protein CAPTEDRAFT_221535 [Capitella teleta]|eukprot:ELT89695.1 hypothetical protein CAPTEDRAFT_221535 [Capitella teleta]
MAQTFLVGLILATKVVEERQGQETILLWHYIRHPNVLEQHMDYLCRYLEFENHYILLRSCGILNEKDVETIRSLRTRDDKVYDMVTRLARGKSESLDVLCYSIKKNGTQSFVAEKLKKEYHELVEEALERKAAVRAAREAGDDSCLPRPGDIGAPPLPWEPKA